MPRDTSHSAPWIALGYSRATYYKRIAETRARERLYACLPACLHSPAGLALDRALRALVDVTPGLDYPTFLQALKAAIEIQLGPPSYGIEHSYPQPLTLKKLEDVVK